MTQQEQEAYVRARWGKVLPQEMSFGCLDIVGWSGEVNWQAAFDFTVAREEEIRQLNEEICQMDDLSQMKRQDIDCEIDTAEGYDPSWNDNALVVYVRDLCEYSRTLARLQQALEDLTKGMVKA
jgi:c-di-AMP phosphodiesterase-like protein